MTSSSNTERFVQQLAEQQNRLYGYVYSLVGDHSRAADVLQETNLVLWRKIDEFDSAKPFLAWAFGVARFQVLAHLRDQKRDRLLLDAELVDVISDEAERQAGQMDQLRDALRSSHAVVRARRPNNRHASSQVRMAAGELGGSTRERSHLENDHCRDATTNQLRPALIRRIEVIVVGRPATALDCLSGERSKISFLL